jgi:hypothetical protein
VPLFEPRIDRVSVRVDHAEDGGRSMVTEPSEKLWPRFAVRVCG